MGRKRKKIPAGPDSGLYRLSARRKTDRDNILQKGWKKKPQGGWAYTNSDGTEVSAPTMDLAIIFARKNEVLCTKCGCTDYIPAERKRRSICGNCREAGDEEEEEEEDGEGMEEMQEDVAPGSDADEESAVSGTEEDMELQAELEEPTVTIKYTTTKTNSKKKRMIYIGCQRWRWDRLKGAYTLQNNKEVAQLLLDWYEMSGGAYEKNRDEASRQIIMATLADAHSRSWKRKKEDEGGDEMNASSIGTGTHGTVPICPTRAGQDDAGLPGNHNGNRTISNLANTSQACDHSGGYTAADPCETKTEDGSTVAPSSVPPVAQVPDTTLDKDSTLASEEAQALLGAHILECSSGSDEFNFGGNLQTDTVQVKVEPDDISDSCGSINIETVVKVEQVGETSEDHDHSDDAESELMHQDSVIIPEASDLGPAAEKVFSQTVDTEVEETKTRDLYSKGKVSGLSEQSTSNQAGTSEASQISCMNGQENKRDDNVNSKSHMNYMLLEIQQDNNKENILDSKGQELHGVAATSLPDLVDMNALPMAYTQSLQNGMQISYKESLTKQARHSEKETHIQKRSTTENRFMCTFPSCSYSSSRSCDLVRHVMKHGGEEIKRNQECDKKFFDSNICKESVTKKVRPKKRTSDKRFKCTYQSCSYCSSKRYNLERHVMVKHGGKKVKQCKKCNKKFIDSNALKVHTDIHRRQCLFICDLCSETFNSPQDLNAHIKLVHLGKALRTCRTCGEGFVRKQDYLAHCDFHHRNMKLHDCPLCRKSFSGKKILYMHIRRCVGIKEYKCNGCGQAFAVKGDLSDHVRGKHSLDNAYLCTCGKEFRWRANYNLHRQKCTIDLIKSAQ